MSCIKNYEHAYAATNIHSFFFCRFISGTKQTKQTACLKPVFNINKTCCRLKTVSEMLFLYSQVQWRMSGTAGFHTYNVPRCQNFIV